MCWIRDNGGRCYPPVSICGGFADCNGCPNFGDAFTAPPQFQQVASTNRTSSLYVDAYGPSGDHVGDRFSTGVDASATLQLPLS